MIESVLIDASQWSGLMDVVTLGVTGVFLLIGVLCAFFVGLALILSWR